MPDRSRRALSRRSSSSASAVGVGPLVSTWIGETEKNLRRVLDSGKRHGARLHFDEADALFGRRSQVRDSHDRPADAGRRPSGTDSSRSRTAVVPPLLAGALLASAARRRRRRRAGARVPARRPE